tara:strand:- start:67 stop:366 length:300 start_codon:yes stop_codon:yes gene_type:complete
VVLHTQAQLVVEVVEPVTPAPPPEVYLVVDPQVVRVVVVVHLVSVVLEPSPVRVTMVGQGETPVALVTVVVVVEGVVRVVSLSPHILTLAVFRVPGGLV